MNENRRHISNKECFTLLEIPRSHWYVADICLFCKFSTSEHRCVRTLEGGMGRCYPYDNVFIPKERKYKRKFLRLWYKKHYE